MAQRSSETPCQVGKTRGGSWANAAGFKTGAPARGDRSPRHAHQRVPRRSPGGLTDDEHVPTDPLAEAVADLPADLRGPVRVMLARAAEQVPGPGELRGGAVYEPKWDGYRLVLVHDSCGVTAWSRQGKDLSARFPDVAAAATTRLPVGSVIDGEVVIWHEGRLSFDALQSRLTASASQLVARVSALPASYLAFDVLAAGGEDLRGWPWRERRAALEALAPWRPPLQLSPATTSREEALGWFEDWRAAGVEGLVAKGAESQYEPGGRRWVKVKSRHTQEVVIGAVIGPLNAPEAIVCGLRRDGELVEAGRSTPLTSAQSRSLAQLLRQPRTPHPWPEHIGAGHFGGGKVAITRVEPLLVAEVSADAALTDGRFRHPVRFVRHRPDLDPEHVPPLPEQR